MILQFIFYKIMNHNWEREFLEGFEVDSVFDDTFEAGFPKLDVQMLVRKLMDDALIIIFQ
jgi:hypothetical protein